MEYRKVTAKDASAIAALTRELIESKSIIPGIHIPKNKFETFPTIIEQSILKGTKLGNLVGHIAVDPKTKQVVGYVGVFISKPNTGKAFAVEDWLVTSPHYQKQGIASALRKLNEKALVKREEQPNRIISRASLLNMARRRLDKKTGYKTIKFNLRFDKYRFGLGVTRAKKLK